MDQSGRFATFVETHVKPWQVVVGLAVGVVALVTALVAGTTTIVRHFSSDGESKPQALASAAGDPSSTTWGPPRREFEEAERPGLPVLNSVANNPKYGDERNFVQVRDVNGKWSNSVNLQPGGNYEVSIFVRNNGTAQDSRYTYIRAAMPGVVEAAGKSRYATGFATSSTAIPSEVWGVVTLNNTTQTGLNLRYTPESAKLSVNGGRAEKIQKSDALFGAEGVSVSSHDVDGTPTLGPGETAEVTFRFITDWPSFAYSSSVRVKGTERWLHNTEARRGDRVEIRLAYVNDGSIIQNNVVLKNVLPSSMSYIKGSSRLSVSGYPANKKVSDRVNGDGINIGSYAAGSNAFLYFEAEVTADACGEQQINSFGETENGNKRDRSVVTVTEGC